MCRHRALLYKYLCDRSGIDCELRRGTYTPSPAECAGGESVNEQPHAWNVIRLGMNLYVVDIMHEPTQLYCASSEKAKRYTQGNNPSWYARSCRVLMSIRLHAHSMQHSTLPAP